MIESPDHPSLSQNEKDEVKNCMDSYSKILDVWKVMNDNYFKRVQLFMGIIQVGLFLAALKLLASPQISPKAVILLVFFGIMGLMAAIMWIRLNKKQAQYLEFCRRTLRNIESRFADLNVPLEYFTLESLVFNSHREHKPLYSAEAFIDNPKKIKKRCWIQFHWSQERYPEPDGKDSDLHTMQTVSGGMVFFEKNIAISAIVVWVLIILGTIFLGFCNPNLSQTDQINNNVKIEKPNKANQPTQKAARLISSDGPPVTAHRSG